MKIVIAGKNTIAVNILEHILHLQNIEPLVVLNKTESFKNGFQKSLGFYAKLWRVKIVSLEEVYDLNEVIFLSLEFDRIIKPNLFNTKNLFNIHFSKLPSYKGMYTSALPILHGEKESGVTLHLIDKGIDTGDIIDQVVFKLEENETARSLYKKYTDHGTKLIISNLSELIKNSYNFKPQQLEGSTYYGKEEIDYSNLKIDLKKTACQIDRQLRAYTFREYQLPKIHEWEIGNWSISNQKSKLKPGTITTLDDDKLLVSTIDYDIILKIDKYELLWEACRNNNLKDLKELYCEERFDLEMKSNEGWTALIIAVYNGSLECVKFLIENGADINAQNYNGTTVLMYAKSEAIKSNDFKIVELLLDHNVKLETKDIYGKNILDWTKEECQELYKLFKSKT